MNQPSAELRIWRAWACLHLAEKCSTMNYPRDSEQIKKENLIIPTIEQTLEEISALAESEEHEMLAKLLI